MPDSKETAISQEESIDNLLEKALKLRVSDISQSIKLTKDALELTTKNEYAKGRK